MKRKIIYLLISFLAIGGGKINALTQDNGVYQIATAQDLAEFRTLVNNGTSEGSGSKAQLTADIDLSSISNSNSNWTPMGTDASRFWGTFDGQGHRIKNLTISGSTNEQGLFGVVSTATIKNLILDKSCNINSGACTAALIGCSNGSGTLTIENVGVECDVTGTDQNCAAFLGCNYGGDLIVKITNCWNTGNVKGGRECAIFSGWFGNNGNTRVTNCWNTGTVTGADGSNSLGRGIGSGQFVNTYDLSSNNKIDATKWNGYDSSWMASGEWTYKLNEAIGSTVWYQKIGTDDHPTPFAADGATVYVVGNQYCDGETKPGASYSNTAGTANRDAHNFNDWGFCTNSHDSKTCDQIQPDYILPVNGYYEIANNKQLNWFAVYVNRENNAINGRLTADIDFHEQQVTIGEKDQDGKRYAGTFDGQGHTITIGYTNNGTVFANNIGLFRYIQGATIRNLKVDGSITTTANQMAGLATITRGSSKIQNVVVAVNMKSTHSGDGTHGGIIAVAHDVPQFENVAFVGKIDAPNDYGTCGLIGYAHTGGSIVYRNCYVSGTLNLTGDNNRAFGRNGEYADNSYTTLSLQMLNDADRGGEKIDATLVSSGELAYLLNGMVSGGTPWTQQIGTDSYPIPFGSSLVYANGNLLCDGSASTGTTFANTKSSQTLADHQISDGVCSVCGNWYIESGEQLKAFAEKYNASQTKPNVTATLLNNIDMASVTGYPGIGSNTSLNTRFRGKLIGEEPVIISNLKMDFDREDVGLVNTATGGAVIRNITMAANCEIKGKSRVAAFIGATRGAGDIVVENCGNDGKVTATEANAGGIVGCRFDNNTVYLTNVYNVGIITGGTAGESGSLSGWLTNGVLTNCYSVDNYTTATDTHGFEQGHQFCRGNDIQLTNCYDYGTGDWGKNNGSWGAAFDLNSSHKIKDLERLKDGSLFAGSDPVQRTYTNPVLNSDAPDPSVIRADDGYYYLYSTAEHIYRSPDMVNWTYVRQTFGDNPKGTISSDGEGGVFWAPCITYQNGQYVLYFAVSKTGGESAAWIGVATADNPAGPFRLSGTDGKLFTSGEIGVKNSIDPFYIEDSGKKYLVWGSFHGIYATELSADGLSVKNKSNKSQIIGDGFEAAYIYKHNGYYYLFASIGSTFNGASSTYKTVVGRSTKLLSDYKDKSGKSMEKYDGLLGIGAKSNYALLLQNTSGFYGPGHNSRIIEDANGKTWMYFHAYDAADVNKGRVVCLDEVKWDNDGWPYFEGTGPTKTAQAGPSVAQTDLAANTDGIWHQGLGDSPHPVLYNGVEFDENYAYAHQWTAQDDATVYFYRGVVANMWNTLCVPFDLTTQQVEDIFGEGTKLATLKPADKAYTETNQTMHFSLTAEAKVEAGVPYLIMPTKGITRAGYVTDAIKIEGVSVKDVSPQSVSAGSSYTYWGTFDKTTHPVGDLFVASGNKLNSNNVADGVMRGFRTYFQVLEAGAKPMFFSVEEEPTGIENIDHLPLTISNSTAIYDLQGRKVIDNSQFTINTLDAPANCQLSIVNCKLKPGVYIVNGKKIVVK